MYINMRCSSKGFLHFVLYFKSGQELNYIGKYISRTPGTLRIIPLVVIRCLANITSKTPESVSEQIDAI